jgi:hypothetical protein
MKTISVYESADKKRTSIISFDMIKKVYFVERHEILNDDSEYLVDTFEREEDAEIFAEDWVL